MGQGKAIGLKRLLQGKSYEERLWFRIRYAEAHVRWLKMTGRKRDGSKRRNRQRRKTVASEITVSGSLAFSKSGVTNASVGATLTATQFNVTGSAYSEGTLSVATSATVIPLGGVAAPHWCYVKNLDATNFLRIMNGSAGAKVVKLKPGEWGIFPWDDAAVPYAIADTAACLLEYLIVQL